MDWPSCALRRTAGRWGLAAATIIVVAASVPARASACGFCTTPGGLKIAHPKSLDVAIAIRRALDGGLLATSEPQTKSPADRRFQDLQTARIVAERLRNHQAIELLLIEDGSHFRVESARALRGQQPAASPAIRWVTGRDVMRGLLQGEVTLDAAIQQGLLVVETRHQKLARSRTPVAGD